MSYGMVASFSHTNFWQTLPVGGGGFVSGIDCANDGTLVCRTDVYGAYVWNGTSSWTQLLTRSSIPAPYNVALYGVGAYEIRVAPSNSNVMYMTLGGGIVFYSSNRGLTWTYSGIAPDGTADANAGGTRSMNYKSAIDPNNPARAIVSMPTVIYRTTNGGSSWAAITSSFAPPAGTGGASAYGFLVAWHLTDSNTVYVASYGTGVYKSSDGGATWSAVMSGSPTTQVAMRVSSDGYVYVAQDNVSQNGNGSTTTIYIYNGASWSTKNIGTMPNGIQCVVPDPGTVGRVVVYDLDGNLNISTDHGATWTGATGHTLASTDVGWLTYTNSGSPTAALFGSCGAFRVSVGNEFWAGTGLGVVKCNPPATAVAASWAYTTKGIEELGANCIIKPPGGYAVGGAWDQGAFTSVNPVVYPSTKGTTNNAVGLQACWSLDYSWSTPSKIVALINWPFTDTSGYSLDQGQTWNTFAVAPPNFGPSGGERGGSIAICDANNIVVFHPRQGSNVAAPVYTTNGGTSWSNCTFPAEVVSSSYAGLGVAFFFNPNRQFCADKAQSSTFYAYDNANGFYRSTDGGANWSRTSTFLLSGAAAVFAQLYAVPGNAGNLFCCIGKQSDSGAPVISAGSALYRSTNGGTTWTGLSSVQDTWAFGFGASATGGYPAMYIVGWVSGVWGIYRSDNANQATPTWTAISDGYPLGVINRITGICGDPDNYGPIYVSFLGGGWARYTN